MMKQSKKYPITPEELKILRGQDQVVDFLVSQGLPLTRDSYLSIAYGDDIPEELPAELEAELPEFLQEE